MIITQEQELSCLSLTDRGLAYGDGLFETIACINGELHNWQAHYLRMRHGCTRLKILCPDEVALLSHIQRKLNQIHSLQTDKQPVTGVLKLILTRGNGVKGYQYPKIPQYTLIITWKDWPDIPASHYHTGIEATVCDTRLAVQPLLAGIKHLNRLEQVYAKNELSDTIYIEGVTLDYNEQIIEGTSSNLFFVQNGQLCTPRLDQCGVTGTLRSLVLQTARHHDIVIAEGKYTLSNLQQASEVFFTNSVTGIYPVARLTLDEKKCIGYQSRKIMHRLSQTINRALQRPVIH